MPTSLSFTQCLLAVACVVSHQFGMLIVVILVQSGLGRCTGEIVWAWLLMLLGDSHTANCLSLWLLHFFCPSFAVITVPWRRSCFIDVFIEAELHPQLCDLISRNSFAEVSICHKEKFPWWGWTLRSPVGIRTCVYRVSSVRDDSGLGNLWMQVLLQ